MILSIGGVSLSALHVYKLMNIKDLRELGLYRSVDILVSLTKSPTIPDLITRAQSLFEMQRWNDAVSVLDSIPDAGRTIEDTNAIIELRLKCYFANQGLFKDRLPGLLTRLLTHQHFTPKLHILVAEAHILLDHTRSPTHPAIPHLLEVLRMCPMVIELAEKLLTVGADIDPILEAVPEGEVRLFLEALKHEANYNHEGALECLQAISDKPPCVLNRICINAFACGQMELFDSTARLIPMGDFEIVDLRAARLKETGRGEELSELVLTALNANEDNAAAWLAFSHHQELNGDMQRALQATRKALNLDRNMRRAFMRHGELRMRRRENIKNAITAFVKAHELQEGMDSYTQLVTCYLLTGDTKQAESYTARAKHTFPFDGPHGSESMALCGMTLRTKDPVKAEEHLRGALERNHNNTKALQTLIEMKCEEKDYDGAEAAVREYRESSADFFYWIWLAEIYGLKGDLEQALEFVNNAARLQPYNEHAVELRDRIEAAIDQHGGAAEEEESMFR